MVIDGSPCSKQRFRHEMPREYGRRNGLYEKWPVLAMNGLIGRSSGRQKWCAFRSMGWQCLLSAWGMTAIGKSRSSRLLSGTGFDPYLTLTCMCTALPMTSSAFRGDPARRVFFPRVRPANRVYRSGEHLHLRRHYERWRCGYTRL